MVVLDELGLGGVGEDIVEFRDGAWWGLGDLVSSEVDFPHPGSCISVTGDDGLVVFLYGNGCFCQDDLTSVIGKHAKGEKSA